MRSGHYGAKLVSEKRPAWLFEVVSGDWADWKRGLKGRVDVSNGII